MPYPFRNLVFEGRGVEILTYAGALQTLAKMRILKNIRRVGGMSSGAIVAVLVALNYSPEECGSILETMPLKTFIDESYGTLRDSQRLLSKLGWFSGNSIRLWIGQLIEAKTGNPDSTFKQIREMREDKSFRDIYLIGTNISTKFSEVFSFEHTPRVCVADAVAISMCIPLLMTVRYSPRGDVYVDGGMLDCYPIKLFDQERFLEKRNLRKHSVLTSYYKLKNNRLKNKNISPYTYNKQTLGFRLATIGEEAEFRDQSEPQAAKIDDFYDYTVNLIMTILKGQHSRHLHSNDWHRTIFIDTLGVNALHLDISKVIIDHLMKSGRHGTEAYFKWYDDPKSYPINRV